MTQGAPPARARRGWRALLAIVRRPVGDEARRLLAANWAGLDPALRVPQQMFGRQGNGCGATIGAMPRCDFACRGCYLNAEANRIPAEPVEAIMAQMRQLRPVLGHAGNLQLTDGEVTLRPVEEVIALLTYARSLDLIPMLMTHGDSFRRQPGLLERLMVEGGLTEVSIHVDTTQRGRQGERWRRATTEAELNPLREEFAAMIRAARRATGRPLRAATTMTVTRDNLAGVPDVVRWLAGHADAFRLVSFQPIAQVGRTEDGYGGGVAVEALWAQVAAGLGVDGGASRMAELGVWFGHHACNRMVNGVVVTDRDGARTYHALRDARDPTDVRVVDGFLARFGGISFRLDDPAERWARLAGVVCAAPRFVLGNLLPYAAHWLRRVGEGAVMRGAWRLATGRATATPLVVVSHHFMSREELETPVGRERLAHCVFHVPVDGELVSMCEVNALG
ncbi:MAG: radical SAM protein, partial [Gemmatimonadaceae bacterium]|nr:radical SAM protein [Gemmatimonadaceae bacterium]